MTTPIILITAPIICEDPGPWAPYLKANGFDVVMHRPEGEVLSESELLEYAPNLLALVCGDDQVTRRVIDANPGLKTVCKWGVGVDTIDWKYCAERGVSVRRAKGLHCQSMAEAACAYTLALYKRIVDVDRMVRAGQWGKVLSHPFEGSTIGLVGLGDIGARAARMMSGWPVELLGFDPKPGAAPDFCGTRVGRDELFARAQCVVLMAPPMTDPERDTAPEHAPELDKTLGLMGAGTLLVNVSRGSLTPTPALVEGLESGKLAAAALDVYDVEPLPADSPLRRRFADRILFGAHTAYNAPSISGRVTERVMRNLCEELGVAFPE